MKCFHCLRQQFSPLTLLIWINWVHEEVLSPDFFFSSASLTITLDFQKLHSLSPRATTSRCLPRWEFLPLCTGRTPTGRSWGAPWRRCHRAAPGSRVCWSHTQRSRYEHFLDFFQIISLILKSDGAYLWGKIWIIFSLSFATSLIIFGSPVSSWFQHKGVQCQLSVLVFICFSALSLAC